MTLEYEAARRRRGGNVVAVPAAKRARTVRSDSDDDNDDGPGDGGGGGGGCGRDAMYGSLHVLGKLLYAKRRDDGTLAYDPDALAGACAFDAPTLATFLHDAVPAFYTDMAQLSSCLDVLSVADVTCGRRTRDGVPPDRATTTDAMYGSLVARAVAHHNYAPAPRTFRAMRKPAVYAVARIATDNAAWLRDEGVGTATFAGSASGGSGGSAGSGMWPSIVSARERALWVLPAVGVLCRGGRAYPHVDAATRALACGASGHYGGMLAATAAGEPATTIGAAATSLVRGGRSRGGGGGGGDGDDEYDVDAGGGDETAAAAYTVRRGRAAAVSLSGLQVGHWAGWAALAGVDVTALIAAQRAAAADAPPPTGPTGGPGPGRPRWQPHPPASRGGGSSSNGGGVAAVPSAAAAAPADDAIEDF